MRLRACNLALGAVLLTAQGTPALADPEAGRVLAMRKCAQCHGRDGLSMIPEAPHLAGQPKVYLRAQLLAFRDGSRVNDVMNLQAALLSDQDILDLADWYAAIEITVREQQ